VATPTYITKAALKATLDIVSSTADADVDAAIAAASRGIDGACGRRFYPDADNTKVRFYTPESSVWVEIEDLAAVGTGNFVTIDRAGDGSFSEAWVLDTDYVLEPLNAGQDDQHIRPWERIRVRERAAHWLPCWEKSVRVTGKFGWAAIPEEIIQATTILASKLFKRAREAPFGILTAGTDVGAMRIARTDPDVASLIGPYMRTRPIL